MKCRNPGRLGVSARTARVGCLSAGLALLLVGVALVPAASATNDWRADPLSWTNGIVLCQFSSVQPTASVSALELNGTGLTLGLAAMTEVSDTGVPVATAVLAGVNWTVTNNSGDNVYDATFTAQLLLESIPGPPTQVGSVDLRVDFVLPAYATSTADSVSVELTVTNWTWQSALDHLQATFAVSPSFPATERLAASAEPGWVLTNSEDSSGRALEWMAADPNATAWPASGVPVNISSVPTLTLFSSTSARLAVDFGSGAGAFRSLSYFAKIGVLLPPTVAGVPLVDFVLVAVAAALSALAIAAATWRIRSRPSRFIYADEEKER